MKKSVIPFLCLAASLYLGGCSNTPKDGAGPDLDTYENSDKPKDVVQASREQRPIWSLDLRRWQMEYGEKGMQYFVGAATGKRTKTNAQSEAKLEAMSQISDAIAARITESITKTETGTAITGKDVTPSELFEVVSRRVKKKSNNLINGTKTIDSFSWVRNTDQGALNDTWILLSLTDDEMKKATEAAARKTGFEDQAAMQKVISDLQATKETESN